MIAPIDYPLLCVNMHIFYFHFSYCKNDIAILFLACSKFYMIFRLLGFFPIWWTWDSLNFVNGMC